MEEPELPKLYEQELTDESLTELFEDLGEVAEVLDILLKGGTTERTDGKGVSLEDARLAISQKKVRGAQIRYRFDDKEWRDTLMIAADGRVKLVRIETPTFD